MRIKQQKNTSLTEAERLEIGRLLLKAGYTVTVGKEKPAKQNGAYVHYIEFHVPGQKNSEEENNG